VDRSQPFQVNITHREAKKGAAVLFIALILGIGASQMACIGEMNSGIPTLDVRASLSPREGSRVHTRAHALRSPQQRHGWLGRGGGTADSSEASSP
jgi:hypothetical protein